MCPCRSIRDLHGLCLRIGQGTAVHCSRRTAAASAPGPPQSGWTAAYSAISCTGGSLSSNLIPEAAFRVVARGEVQSVRVREGHQLESRGVEGKLSVTGPAAPPPLSSPLTEGRTRSSQPRFSVLSLVVTPALFTPGAQ